MYNTEIYDRMTLDEKHEFFMDAYDQLRRNGVIKKWKEFAELIDVSANSISGAKNKNPDYLTSSLLVKIGDTLDKFVKTPITINHSPNSNVATGQGQINISTPIPNLQPQSSQEDDNMVPVIPLNLYKESDVNILEYINDDDNNVQTTPAVQQFPKTDAIYSVQTMAMYPHLHQGDLLALKAIKKSTSIVNGEMYAIDTIDNGIIVRFAYDRGDYLELKASERADRFESFTIKKKDIYTIFRVVGMIRTNI